MNEQSKGNTEPLIYKAMCKIMKDVGAIGKNSKNTQQGYTFRGIDDMYNALHDILAKNDVFTMPQVISERSETMESKAGRKLIYRILTMKYVFYTKDGSSVYSVVQGEGMDSGDKASNKAMSIAHKYCLLQAFSIPTKGIDDPDFEQHELKSNGKGFGKPIENPKPKPEVKPEFKIYVKHAKEMMDTLEWTKSERSKFMAGYLKFEDYEWQSKIADLKEEIKLQEDLAGTFSGENNE